MNIHDWMSSLLMSCGKSVFILAFFPAISSLLDEIFEARTVSYIVAHVVAIPLGVFLLVAFRCIESCTLLEGPVVLFVRKNNRILLSKLKNGHRDANSSGRCELLEKISLDLKGLESYSNTDDLRGNIIEAIRLEIENDVKVENNC
ncbi:hypothetical protein Tco_0784579 [Tanacetum coccineum]